jgi:hypothetical protein
MLENSKLYEINTRVWIKQFGNNTHLHSIPEDIFKELSDLGFSIIWFMGVWKTCNSVIHKRCFTPDLVSGYSKALKDWQNDDIIGSPYAIDCYELNPIFGDKSDLLRLKERLNKLGLKLFLDFVPNHFSSGSKFLKSNPEVFLEADEELLEKGNLTFFKDEITGRIFAHGRDPFFLPWTDTAQVNFFSKEARSFMIEQLFQIAELCDGIRCDMTMLPLNNVFHNTWLGVLNKFNFKKPENEFWEDAIIQVKKKYPDFVFLAETYWDLEWQLQKLGFDFTYDKRLTDRLASGDINSIKAHLLADQNYQMKSVRFIENHDEERAVAKFGKERSLAAAVFISTIKGMKLYYDGQFEGKKIKLPLQLGREPEKRVSERVKKHYYKLFEITKEDIFKYGNWNMIEPVPAGESNTSFLNFFTWVWQYEHDLRIVVINYSERTSQCRLKFQIKTDQEKIILHDLFTGEKYARYVKEIYTSGLFIELKGFNSHIFAIHY